MIVGIIGAGQLARMLALAGIPLGVRFVFLDPAPDACAAQLGRYFCGAYDDPDQLERFAGQADVVTCEFENVPDHSIAYLARYLPVYPHADALAAARDRLQEKNLFRSLDIPVTPFTAVDSLSGLFNAVSDLGLPAVLKTRTMGYDGKGQSILRTTSDIKPAWDRMKGAALILERLVDFRRELSVIAVRDRDGRLMFYPLTENTHTDGILRMSRCRHDDICERLAREYATRLLKRLAYVGVLVLELFDTGEGLFANEMAPRVHNSGHWTIEGAETSQFENHLRAVLGLPLGAVGARGYSAMVNFIGETPNPAEVLAVPGAHLHFYGKIPRPGRKLGHATLCASNAPALQESLDRLLDIAHS